ncbi:carboxylesterase/lipase family protein [Sphingomonas sp. QA11]|uniref:carboxylesterase/lipase family protein n=1 Tax=Sphingomonas sp. QA11 TaxID=2950605 RepID=UPI00234940AA|nr:carboxylesterase/lipase family protein [Sphingomonas sp. QA11]WCM25030.1 carboxylesterase/lipase family protein [Sphingomonas sp. QA11]
MTPGAFASPTRRAMIAGSATMLATGVVHGAGDPVIACRAGRFVGERRNGVAAFRGIRYGQARRFRAPTAAPVLAETVRATESGPACPQRGKRRPQAEDCLSLNIWTPAPGMRARLPVMVWIHGGGYAYGSANDPITDGRQLAAAGEVVVVTVNHRLNALGYLYLARLDAAFPDSGNAGQLDLVLALQWVRDNVAAFGGDPARVTLIGQSGGGAKIATLMAMPAARGLFRRAITMSGQQVTVSGPVHATRRARAYLARLGLKDTESRRLFDQPVEKLIEALDADDPIERGAIYMGSVLDDRWLTRHPFWPDAHPIGLDVDLMLGGTRDETRDFSDPASPEMRALTWEALPDRIAAELPVDLSPEAVVSAYRAHMPAASPADIFYAATTDGRSWRPQVIEAEVRARAGRPAYVYQVDFASPTNPSRGAFHGIDIGLVFGTLDAPDALTGTGPDTRALAWLMQRRFVAFARTGNPNLAGLSAWSSYDEQRRATMIFDIASRVENDPRRWQRALFAPVPYTQPGT